VAAAGEGRVTQRSLVALSAIVLVLAAAVVLDRPAERVDPAASRRIFPELALPEVTRVVWTRPGEPDLVLAWQGEVARIADRPTDPTEVRELVASLESLAARGQGRDVPEAGLDPPAFRLAVTYGGRTETIDVGKRQPALGRTFVRRGGDIFAVDDYAARALDRRADDLRQRHPFPDPATGKLVLGEVSVEGDCLSVGGGACARADAVEVAALRERLASLRLTRFLATAPEVEALRLAVGEVTLFVGGDCPSAPLDRLVTGALGPACAAAEELDAITEPARNPMLLLDRSLLGMAPGRVKRIAVTGGARLVREAAGWRLGDEPADEESVTAWLDELASYRAGELDAVRPTPGKPDGALALEVEDDAGRVVVTWIERGTVLTVRRPGDGVALLFHPDLLAVVSRDPVRFAERTVLEVDPYAIAAVVATEAGIAERAERGATQDRWQLTTPTAVAADTDLVATLRETVTSLRAVEIVAARAAPVHGLDPPRRRIRFALDDESEVALELGTTLGDGRCYARRVGVPRVVLLAATACQALSAHLPSRQVVDLDSRDVLAVGIGPERWTHQGPSWYDARGQRARGEDAVRLAALVRSLATSPGVAGYGAAQGTRVVLTTTRGDLAFRVGGGELGLEGRPVRYRSPPELCQRWPALCQIRR
jgi:Domain of unknown function (DUF4340)